MPSVACGSSSLTSTERVVLGRIGRRSTIRACSPYGTGLTLSIASGTGRCWPGAAAAYSTASAAPREYPNAITGSVCGPSRCIAWRTPVAALSSTAPL
jgi:hypothetical protein